MIIINLACIVAIICSFLLITVGLTKGTPIDRFLWSILFGIMLIVIVFITQLKVGGWS